MNIKGKQKLPLILAVSFALLAALHCARADGEMSAAAVLDLLPTGPDIHDLREKANLEKLIGLGEAAFPGLLDIIRTDNSPYVAGRALGVLRCSQNASPAARREVVTELGKVLYDRKSLTGYRDERTLSLMAQAIADMGEAGDAMLLLPLLDHPSGDVRSAGYSGMEKLAAKAVPQGSPVDGKPLAQDIGNVATEREPVPQAKKTYQDYPEWYLLPKSFDLEDENVLAAFQRLVDEGEAAHEAMVAIAKECENSMVASYALSVLRESSGDKREAVAELKQFFAARFPNAEGEEVWRMTFIAETLADIGTEDDVTVLAPMLTHPNMRVRYLGAQYLGQRGGQQAMEALERAKSRESNNLVLDEMNKAVASISSRLAEQDAQTPPSP